ncbi:UNVERIFIED_CONTAM: hypothetical protein RMT77_003218 [Armadillidium vulgare]
MEADSNEKYNNISSNLCPFNAISNISEVELPNNTLPSDLAVPLYGYALPIIVLVTTVANTMIVAVLAQRHMRTPTNVLLIAISLSDLMTLITPAPIFFYMYTLGHYELPLFPKSLCYTWYYFYDIFPNTFHTTSIWLTLALGVQRYIYVCHPPLARIYCNVPRVIKVVISIVAAALLHQSVRFFEFRYTETCVFWDGELIPACDIFYTAWVGSNINLYFGFYYWFRVIFVHLGPCTILVVLNILLFKALRKAERKRMKLLRENRKKECLRLRDSNCTTMMLIVILSVFLITEIPLAVITLLHIFSSLRYIIIFTPDEYPVIQKFFIISNFFITLSYPINFAIYCGMSRQFLETFWETFFLNQICKKKTSSVSATQSQRSSVTALSFRQKSVNSKGTTNQCCISTIGQNGNSPESSSKEDQTNNYLTPEYPNRSKEAHHLNSSSRSVSFILEEPSKAPDNSLASQDDKNILLKEDIFNCQIASGDENKIEEKTLQETEI